MTLRDTEATWPTRDGALKCRVHDDETRMATLERALQNARAAFAAACLQATGSTAIADAEAALSAASHHRDQVGSLRKDDIEDSQSQDS